MRNSTEHRYIVAGTMAAVALVTGGCSAIIDWSMTVDETEALLRSVTEIRASSVEIVGLLPEHAPCRSDWVALAAEASEVLRTAERDYRQFLNGSAGSVGSVMDAPYRYRGYVANRVGSRIAAVTDCLDRGGLTPEELIEFEAGGKTHEPAPHRHEPAQREAVERIRRLVA